MSEIKIKEESLPQRCEICHKADLFNPEFNCCSRCNALNLCEQAKRFNSIEVLDKKGVIVYEDNNGLSFIDKINPLRKIDFDRLAIILFVNFGLLTIINRLSYNLTNKAVFILSLLISISVYHLFVSIGSRIKMNKKEISNGYPNLPYRKIVKLKDIRNVQLGQEGLCFVLSVNLVDGTCIKLQRGSIDDSWLILLFNKISEELGKQNRT